MFTMSLGVYVTWLIDPWNNLKITWV